MKPLLLFIILLLFAQISWAQKDSTAFIDDAQVFMNGKDQYDIIFPSNWKRDYNDIKQVIFMGPPIDSGLFKTDGSFGLNVSPIMGVTTKEAVEGTLHSVKEEKTFSNYKLEECDTIIIDGKKFEYIIFQVEIRGVVFTSLQFYLVYKNSLYIMGGTLPSPSLGKYRDIYFGIAKTFKFHAEKFNNNAILKKVFLNLNTNRSNIELSNELKKRPGFVYEGKAREEVPGTNSKNTFTNFNFTGYFLNNEIKKGTVQFQSPMLGEKESIAIYLYFDTADESENAYYAINQELGNSSYSVTGYDNKIYYEGEKVLVFVNRESAKDIHLVTLYFKRM